jgi:outer membrane protein assembly factor BamD (BamD/ComL family)
MYLKAKPMRRSAFAITTGTLVFSFLAGCAAMQKPTLPKLTDTAAAEQDETRKPARLTGRVPDWLSPQRLATQIKGPPPDEVAARALFERAENQFRAASKSQGEARLVAFEEAADIYELSAHRGEGFPIAEDALLMTAESHFFADNYAKAAESYGALVKAFPNTQYIDRVDKRRFAIAQYWLQHPTDATQRMLPNLTDQRRPMTDTLGHALKLFDRIRFDDPAGTLSDDATMAAALSHFQRGRYEQAEELFRDIRENFPSSEHRFQAHLLGLKSNLMSYGGPAYSGGSLDDAEKLIRQVVTQFPREAQEHYELLENARKEIRLKKAQREFVVAQYYDGRQEYRAARMHYENVRRDFADTNLAVEAESRLAQLEGRPDVPAPTLQWLADLFPDEPTRQDPLIRPSPTGAKK